MKSLTQGRPVKLPVNLLLNEATVRQAGAFTRNLSSTVDGLLAEFVARERLSALKRRTVRSPTSIGRYEPVRRASQCRVAGGAGVVGLRLVEVFSLLRYAFRFTVTSQGNTLW